MSVFLKSILINVILEMENTTWYVLSLLVLNNGDEVNEVDTNTPGMGKKKGSIMCMSMF